MRVWHTGRVVNVGGLGGSLPGSQRKSSHYSGMLRSIFSLNGWEWCLPSACRPPPNGPGIGPGPVLRQAFFSPSASDACIAWFGRPRRLSEAAPSDSCAARSVLYARSSGGRSSAEVEPAVAVPIAPALQLQPGAPSNGNLNPVPSARTLRPYPLPVPSALTHRPYSPPVPSARTLGTTRTSREAAGAAAQSCCFRGSSRLCG